MEEIHQAPSTSRQENEHFVGRSNHLIEELPSTSKDSESSQTTLNTSEDIPEEKSTNVFYQMNIEDLELDIEETQEVEAPKTIQIYDNSNENIEVLSKNLKVNDLDDVKTNEHLEHTDIEQKNMEKKRRELVKEATERVKSLDFSSTSVTFEEMVHGLKQIGDVENEEETNKIHNPTSTLDKIDRKEENIEEATNRVAEDVMNDQQTITGIIF